jgi:RimJ/RimL family protein N-acetyltransferase
VYYGRPSWFCWNIGISILLDYQHKGVGTKSQAALVRYLFDTSPVPRIEAYTDVGNIAEQRARTKIGFIREGVLRSTQFRETVDGTCTCTR